MASIIRYLHRKDLEYSSAIYSFYGGEFFKYTNYMFSCFFMEELIIGTIFALHFYFGEDWYLTGAYFFTFSFNLLMTLVTKKMIRKNRPEIETLPVTPKTVFFRKKQTYNGSMPSGDTIQAWTLGLFALMYLPSWKFWLVSPVMIMTPFSRVYLYCHFISDTIVGAVFASIGVVCSYFILKIPFIENFLKGI